MDGFSLALLLGLSLGIVIGLIPGIGLSAMLLSIAPILATQDLAFAVVTYSVACCVAQYFGSITALCFGIAGENTSVPLLKLRERLPIEHTLYYTAVGSFVGSIATLLVTYIALDWLTTQTAYLKTYMTIALIGAGMALSIVYSSNRWHISLGFVCVGAILGKVGYDAVTQTSFLTFDNMWLYGGLPTLPVVLGLLAVPQMIGRYEYVYSNNSNYANIGSYGQTYARATGIGAISGLIPYVGSTLSSFIAMAAERRIRPADHVAHAVASETANNAAAITVLIPLLTLGIAIVPSEWILLEILALSNIRLDFSEIYEQLIIALLFANGIAFHIATRWTKQIIAGLRYAGAYIGYVCLVLSIAATYYFGEQYAQGLYYLTIMFACSIVGCMWRKYDTLPIVFAFLSIEPLHTAIRNFNLMYL